MNPERYALVKEIFLTVGALPPDRRSAFLDSACSADAELRAEVESLLASGEDPLAALATGALAGPLLCAIGAEAPVPPAARRLPDRIGPCRILGILGEGGMGIVYHAEQTEPVRREVALKLVRGGEGSSSVLARFEAERQTLALMDHPSIAKLYEAGCTENGNPYFLMEMVRGMPLGDYVRLSGAGQRERVELFGKICSAVRHAHQRGVIHRDLKPSNILVTRTAGEPQPRVIDFSIAKALADPMVETRFRTREGQLVGTLEYMAPEQAAGRVEAVDTRTDVYALGVILYELLAGCLPVDTAGVPLGEACRRICENPPRPLRGTRSTTAGPGGTRVDADLATIAGKCLEKDPDRRYGSASELAEDVDRYLASRPIAARPSSHFYRSARFVARHRVASAFAATVLILLMGFAVTTRTQLNDQRRARAIAETERARVESVVAFLQEMIESADPQNSGGDMSVRTALDRAARNATSGRIRDPEVAAEIELALGRAYTAIGRHDEAMAHLQEGLALRRRQIADPAVPDLLSARIYAAIGKDAQLKGDNFRSLAAGRLAASMGFSLEGPGSPLAAVALVHVAAVESRVGLGERAIADAERAEEILREAGPEHEPDLARGLVLLGMIHGGEKGEQELREAGEISKAHFGEESVDYLNSLNALSLNLQVRERVSHEELVAIGRRLLAGFRKLGGEGGGSTAMAANNLAALLMREPSGLREAAGLYREAHEIWDRSEVHHYAVAALGNAALVTASVGDFEGAVGGYRQALEERHRDRLESDGFEANHLLYLGVVEHLIGPDPEAEMHIREGLARFERIAGPESSPAGEAHGWLGCLLVDTGHPEEGDAQLRQAIELEVRYRGEEAMGQLVLLNRLGRALAAEGKREEAEAAFARSRAWLLDRLDYPLTLRHELEETAVLYDSWGRRTEADACRARLRALEGAIRADPATTG